MVNSREILTVLGIRAAKTLTRWQKEGLIPPPKVSPHPAGHGRIGYWPDWVLERCREIKRLTDNGVTLAEIKKGLAREPEDGLSARPRRQNAKALRAIAYDNCSERLVFMLARKVSKLLHDMGVKRPGIDRRIENDLEQDERTIKQLVELVARGYNPVLLLGKDLIAFVPDFKVSLYLAANGGRAQPLCVLPVLDEVLEVFSKGYVVKLPRQPVIRPVPRVHKEGSEGGEFKVDASNLMDHRLQ